ncbi:MAG: DUF368 domain-containing protein [Idiomarina sp.]|nr:DUF368 domain-containing protein [Idiomarina sp.]
MKQYINWMIKGLAMGAADIVPGVSGGTLAFILGIYERFLNALTSFNLQAFHLLRRGRIRSFWHHIDGAFLCCLFGGILISIASLASIVTHFLEHRPVPLWALFNGLIIAALPWLLKPIQFTVWRSLLLCFGVILALSISFLAPVQTEPMPWMFFLAGFIAICAMILPGISGSFLLLLMGMYAPIVAAVSNAQLAVLGLFATGCVLGLLIFSRVLTALLKRFHDGMLAMLCGVVIGALYRIWPWQLDDQPTSPGAYAAANGHTDLLLALVFFVLGALMIQGLMKLETMLGGSPAKEVETAENLR